MLASVYNPDLSLIEKVWAMLKNKLKATGSVKSLDELNESVQQTCAELRVSYFRSLFENFPHKLRECIKHKRHPINY